MTRSYQAEIANFGKAREAATMTYREAVDLVRDGGAAAVLLSMLSPEGLERWWTESAFPDLARHRNYATAATSGIAIGGLQRLEKEKLVVGLIDYFSYAARMNDSLRQTALVRLCADELGAESLKIGDWGEFPLASRREFVANAKGPYSVGPHCDALHFGRDVAIWPIKEGYDEGGNQVSTVLTINEAANGAGIVLWNLRPRSRPELDVLMAEYAEKQSIADLEGRDSIAVRAKAGQMTVLNTRLLHAVEQCETPRRTVGAFLIWHGGRWHMFH